MWQKSILDSGGLKLKEVVCVGAVRNSEVARNSSAIIKTSVLITRLI